MWQIGELPIGYDHKYTYSHLGYNLKPLDLQAAIGRIQLQKLHHFCESRKYNWEFLRQSLSPFEDFLEFALPTHATSWDDVNGFHWDDSECRTNCSWFGFKIAVKDYAPFTRADLSAELDRNLIGNRTFFGGNLLRQPAFVDLKNSRSGALRTINELPGSEEIMRTNLFVGTYPGLTLQMKQKISSVVSNFCNRWLDS